MATWNLGAGHPGGGTGGGGRGGLLPEGSSNISCLFCIQHLPIVITHAPSPPPPPQIDGTLSLSLLRCPLPRSCCPPSPTNFARNLDTVVSINLGAASTYWVGG